MYGVMMSALGSVGLIRLISFSVLICACVSACQPQAQPHAQPQALSSSSPSKRAETNEKTNTETWLFVGDSLTAGFGLAPDESYVAVLERALHEEGYMHLSLRNAGVSGDTSAGVKRRLGWLLKTPSTVMFLCIGANDGLRGLSTEALKDNLTHTITEARERGVKRVVLMGMRLPPNYGADYVARFEAVYPEVAKALKVPFLPFLLEGVATEPSLNLKDGIHPNAEGQRRVAQHLKRFIKAEGLLKAPEQAPPQRPEQAPR
jgi:acyl-CoA thioesterase-1